MILRTTNFALVSQVKIIVPMHCIWLREDTRICKQSFRNDTGSVRLVAGICGYTGISETTLYNSASSSSQENKDIFGHTSASECILLFQSEWHIYILNSSLVLHIFLIYKKRVLRSNGYVAESPFVLALVPYIALR